MPVIPTHKQRFRRKVGLEGILVFISVSKEEEEEKGEEMKRKRRIKGIEERREKQKHKEAPLINAPVG